MDRFMVGQEVRVVNDGTMIISYKKYLGKVKTIIAVEHLVENKTHYRLSGVTGSDNYFIENHLAPLYDGDEKISWTECAWKPKVLLKQ